MNSRGLTPSPHGELENTDLNKCCLSEGALYLERSCRGYISPYTRNHLLLLEDSHYIETIEARQGLHGCCPEEIAWNNSWIGQDNLVRLAKPLNNNDHGAVPAIYDQAQRSALSAQER